MIRLTYAQIMAFQSPVMSKLLSSDDRQFPVDDAIRLAEFIDQIQSKIKLFKTQARKIVDKHGGIVEKDGTVRYAKIEDQLTIESELEKLNDVEVELMGDLLAKTTNWPDLNIYEAMILRPLIDTIDTNGGSQNAEKDGKGA